MAWRSPLRVRLRNVRTEREQVRAAISGQGSRQIAFADGLSGSSTAMRLQIPLLVTIVYGLGRPGRGKEPKAEKGSNFKNLEQESTCVNKNFCFSQLRVVLGTLAAFPISASPAAASRESSSRGHRGG